MPDALDEQIKAFEALLPAIKKDFGPVWVLIADRDARSAQACLDASVPIPETA